MAALTAPAPVQHGCDAHDALRKSGPTPRNPRARQAGLRSCEHTPAASRSRWRCRANSRRGTPRHRRGMIEANQSFSYLFPRAESRTGCDMRLCLPARMGGGGKAESTPWRGPAGAQRPPLGGGYSALGTRGQSPWRSRPIKQWSRQAPSLTSDGTGRFLSRNAAQERHPCTARRRRTPCVG
jgi:hypothetical protein